MSYTFAYLTPKKIYTPTTVHLNNLTTMPSSTNYILIPQSTKPELFFNNKIFNTYVLSEEENVYILYHINNELVFIDKSVKLNYNTIYIVEVKEETSFYKKVMIYKPMIYKGRVKKGNFLAEECYLGESDKFIEQEVNLVRKINENKNKIKNTIEFEDKCFGLISKGKIIYRNVHEENDSFYTVLINKDTFLEYTCNLNYILTGKIICVDPIKVSYHNLTITVLENLPPTFVDKSTKLFYTNQSEKYSNRSVKVRIIKERLGMLLGSFDLGVKEGEIRTAIVTRITDKLVFLEINSMKGRMLRNEERNLWVKKSVKGIVTKVENNFFEFSVLKLKEREFYDEFDKSNFELPFFEENSFEEERSLLKK